MRVNGVKISSEIYALVMQLFTTQFILHCIIYIIDRGAFGVVHRCVEKVTGNTFVAKFVNTPYPTDKQTMRNEVNLMNGLHHPKLLNLHDGFEDKDEMCLILEL